jgi:NAD+ synthetase
MFHERVVKNIQSDLRNYIIKHGLKSLVLGVSGGADSALVAALASPICIELKIPLIGLSIPIATNKDDEKDRARAVGKNFCTSFYEIDLTPVYEQEQLGLWDTINDLFPKLDSYAIANGNLKARMRMRLLYHVAGITGGLVLGTDNYTELCLGFWTLHGDVGDVGMIQNLWKTEVYQLMRFMAEDCNNQEKYDALMACVTAVPTDGLGITNSDLDQLGASTYDEVDKILQMWTQNRAGRDAYEDHPVIIRHIKTGYKRCHPYNISRDVVLKGAL